MNIRNTVLSLIIFGSAFINFDIKTIDTHTDLSKKSEWSKLHKAYATSLVSGALIGSFTSILSVCASCKAYNMFIKKTDSPNAFLITFITILSAEYNLRNRLVTGLNESFKDYSIENKPNVTSDMAWIASWIAFFSIDPLMEKYILNK